MDAFQEIAIIVDDSLSHHYYYQWDERPLERWLWPAAGAPVALLCESDDSFKIPAAVASGNQRLLGRRLWLVKREGVQVINHCRILGVDTQKPDDDDSIGGYDSSGSLKDGSFNCV
jgi:hypothetical protein